MSFPRYESYKDSGVEWLGEVPAHWESANLRWLSKRYSGGTPDKLNLDYWTDGSIPWINSSAVNMSIIKEPSTYITEEAFFNSSAKWVPENALVMALAGQGKTKGMVAQLAIKTTCNQSMAAIIPSEEIKSRFLYWWLVANYQNIRNMAGGDLRDGLNLEILGNIPCPLLPLIEQQTIAIFLDRETTKIDELIAEQQRLIELLKEKRQAVISHAVTKGLNPDVPMKDSGIEWLGEVPAHWDILKGCQIGRIFGSEQIPEIYVTEEGELPFIKVGSLSLNYFQIESWDWYVDTIIAHEYQAKTNFIVFPKRGAAIFTNKVNIVERKSLIDPNLMGWEMGDRVDIKFIAYTLKSRKISELADVSTVPQINNKHINPERFPVPPLEEQSEIVLYLDRQTTIIDELIAEAQRAIELLKERRTALISAAVTGKIDVRGLVTD